MKKSQKNQTQFSNSKNEVKINITKPFNWEFLPYKEKKWKSLFNVHPTNNLVLKAKQSILGYAFKLKSLFYLSFLFLLKR